MKNHDLLEFAGKGKKKIIFFDRTDCSGKFQSSRPQLRCTKPKSS